MKPHCEVEGCTRPVAHAEHWYERIRYWCEEHVPMSGHYESCPEPCGSLMKQVRPPSTVEDLNEVILQLSSENERLRSRETLVLELVGTLEDICLRHERDMATVRAALQRVRKP